MAPPSCAVCTVHRAEVKRPRTGQVVCKQCFFEQVEREVHETVVSERMFRPGDVVASGASGGKDSTVLIHLLTLLNERYDYGLDIRLVSIDEGIVGYRDDSLVTVQDNAKTYNLPLHVLSYQDLFGWTMDEIVKAVGLKNNCTYCGVLRRQALERGATIVGANVIATGHNADDNAETFLMNVLRADIPRLNNNNNNNNSSTGGSNSCNSTPGGANSTTGETTGASPLVSPSTSSLQGLRRVKPMKNLYQKDIVMYAYHKKLVYFTTECTYAQEAYRGTVRNLIKQLESIQPQCIAHIIRSSESFPLREEAKTRVLHHHVGKNHSEEANSSENNTKRPRTSSSSPSASGLASRSGSSHKGEANTTSNILRPCSQCGAATNQLRCRACVLLASLEKVRSNPLNNMTTSISTDQNTNNSTTTAPVSFSDLPRRFL